MSLITIPNTFSAGAVIIASQHNSNFSTIYSDYNGNIDNNNISPSAAIAYSKLNLVSSIRNSDVNTSFPIVGSNLDLSTPGIIGGTLPANGTFTNLNATTTLKLGSTHQGDVLYDNGTSIVRLTPGTSGQFLKTLGAGANPLWATPGLSLISTTAIAAATNSGDISITSSNYYQVSIQITTMSSDQIGLRFNNDTASHYGYVYKGFDTSAGTISGVAATASASSILITPTNAVSTTVAPYNIILYIFPQGTTSNKRIFINGNSFGTIAGGAGAMNNIFGSWENSADATSFRIFTTGSNNMTGSVFLYQIASS